MKFTAYTNIASITTLIISSFLFATPIPANSLNALRLDASDFPEHSLNDDDPFAQATKNETSEVNPFGISDDEDDHDPFGGGSEEDTNTTDPFGSDDDARENPFASKDQNRQLQNQKPQLRKAQVSAQAKRENTAPKPTGIATTADVEKKLEKMVQVEYYEVPFSDIMADFSDKFKITLVLDQSARDDSLMEDELVTFNIRNVNLSTALHLMLFEKNATYLVRDGVLRFISLDVASDPEYFGRRIYDCRELLAKISKSDPRVGQPTAVRPLIQTHRHHQNSGSRGGFGGGGAGGAGGGGVFAMNNRQQVNATSNDSVAASGQATSVNDANQNSTPNFIVHRVTANELLTNLILDTIAPDSWDVSNGDGTLAIVGGLMVVSQTQHTLEEIEKFLFELNQKMD